MDKEKRMISTESDKVVTLKGSEEGSAGRKTANITLSIDGDRSNRNEFCFDFLVGLDRACQVPPSKKPLRQRFGPLRLVQGGSAIGMTAERH